MPSSITTTVLAGTVALAIAGAALGLVCILVVAALIWEAVVSWPT